MQSSQPKNSAQLTAGRSIPETEVRPELEKILQSDVFRGSVMLKRFLQYAVERTFDGQGGELKEYRVGVDVLDRPPTFDPRLDPAVRMAARRLRAKLAEYYGNEGKLDPVRIEIPKGSYAAVFFQNIGLAVSTEVLDDNLSLRDQQLHPTTDRRRHLRILSWPAFMSVVVIGILLLVIYFALKPRPPILAETDSILISDFTNTTGDPVFNETLKEGLSVQLQQSPLINVISDESVHATLKLMTQAPDTKLTPELAREVCQRAGCRLYVEGSISRLGGQFVIGLRAVDWQTSNTLAQEQVSAANKEQVLNALGRAVAGIRARIGESRATLQRFGIPLNQATTSSLEALQAFSMGNRERDRRGDAATIPFFQRAIDLDPNFALAYNELGLTYSNLDEPGLAAQHISKAYELRERISERERFQISANYSQLVTGELEKANQICEEWAETYPRDAYPHNLLGVNYEFLGEYENAVKETVIAVTLNPSGAVLHSNLMEDYTALDRLKDAASAYQLALQRNLDHPYLHADMYGLAFANGNRAEMDEQLAWSAGKAGAEDLLFSFESDTSAFYGKLGTARGYSRQAVASALRSNQRETAALWQINAALREAEFGNRRLARDETEAALKIASTRDVKVLAAVVLARAGSYMRADEIADELQKQFPMNTVLVRYWLPTIGAANHLERGDPAKAIEILQSSSLYETGYPNPQVQVGRFLYPAYLRGEALLRISRGADALVEFRKLTHSRSLVLNSPLAVLAQLGTARAYRLEKDIAKSRSAYESFFDRWKDADREIPILKEARSEYAKLQ